MMKQGHKNALFLFVILFAGLAFFGLWHYLQRPVRKTTVDVEHKQTVPIPAITTKARIAIVLDDWGYNGSVAQLLYKIKSPITIAVLPDHKFSRSIAAEAKAKGYQVILHLPLESRSNQAPEKTTLYCSMSEQEIRQRLGVLLKSVPGITGVNNHQGSKATEDARMMEIVLSELKKAGVFFLDSRTTGKSVSPEVARSVGIDFAQSDGFLDLPPSKLQEKEYHEYVRGNLDKIYAVALKRGSAICIGHDLKITLDVLRTEIPRLEKKGIKFVFLSEMVK